MFIVLPVKYTYIFNLHIQHYNIVSFVNIYNEKITRCLNSALFTQCLYIWLVTVFLMVCVFRFAEFAGRIATRGDVRRYAYTTLLITPHLQLLIKYLLFMIVYVM